MRVKMRPDITLMMGLMMGTTVSSLARQDYYGRDDDCYKEVHRGLRIEPNHVDKYVKAGSLRDCERACDIAFFSCKSFSYSDYHTREPENCLLSREDTQTLDIGDIRDFYNDQDFVFYEKASGRHCNYEDDHHNHHHSSDICYELVKTRERIDSRYILRVLKTKDRQECEEECTRVTSCLGFNYRYKTLGYNQYRDNCELSTRDASDRYDFKVDDDFDFYEQSTDSRNCHSSGSNYYGGSGGSNHHGGGSNYHGGSSNYNSGGSNYNSGGSNYNSGGSNYNSGGYNNNNNYGSGVSIARDECFRLAKTETMMESRVVRDRFEVRDIGECELECTRSRYFTCRSFAFRYGTHSGRDRENCFITDREYRELSTYDLSTERSFDFYERRLYDRECGTDSSAQVDAGDITVSGVKCHHAYCQEDRHGGYYFCQTDFSGAWDFCCRPREVCGYSEGYESKWCYVGIEGRDQWRPCTGQGPGREYLKEASPNAKDFLATNATNIELVDLNVELNEISA